MDDKSDQTPLAGSQRPIKRKGPLRTEVVLPLAVVIALVGIYFWAFFDHHLRKALEWVGYQVVGAEVNIQHLETHFFRGSVKVVNVEVTNPAKPTHDMLVLGEIRFALSWDGLLRGKAIVDEVAVEQIAIDVARKKPGRVKPPDPPQPPGAVSREADKFKRESVLQIQKDYEGNVLSDLAGLLGGRSVDEQLKNIQSQLISEKKITEAQTLLDQKSKEWQERLKSLPKPEQIDQIGKDISQIKTSGFSGPQDILENVQKLQKIIQSADSYIKSAQSVAGNVGSDFQNFQSLVKDLEKSVREDVASLEKKLKIPKIDPKSLTQSLVMGYVEKRLQKFSYYKNLAQKYLPPKYLKKTAAGVNAQMVEADTTIQPHPRKRGVTYEFGREHAYPIFWVKKISISSHAMPEMGVGNFSGLIQNVSSNQAFVGEPTTIRLAGDFPGQQIMGFTTDAALDNIHGSPLIQFRSAIESFPIQQAVLVESNDMNVNLESATGKFRLTGTLNDFEKAELEVENDFSKSVFAVRTPNQIIKTILQNTFQKLDQSYIKARLWGDLPLLSSSLDSNIGTSLATALSAEIQKQINDLRKQIEDRVQGVVKTQKDALEKSFAQNKTQIDGEIKKVTGQIEGQKKQAENRVKDSQKSGVKQGEDLLNNLKKGLGF